MPPRYSRLARDHAHCVTRLHNGQSRSLRNVPLGVPHCRSRCPLHGLQRFHFTKLVELFLRDRQLTYFRESKADLKNLAAYGFAANVAVNHPVNSKICTLFRNKLLSDNQAVYPSNFEDPIAIKSQLVLNVAAKFLHIRNSVVERAVNVVLAEIVDGMAMKDRVELRGFGAFYSKDRAGRIARNPKSGAKVEVPKKKVPVFRASKEMGKRLNAAPIPERPSERASSR